MTTKMEDYEAYVLTLPEAWRETASRFNSWQLYCLRGKNWLGTLYGFREQDDEVCLVLDFSPVINPVLTQMGRLYDVRPESLRKVSWPCWAAIETLQ